MKSKIVLVDLHDTVLTMSPEAKQRAKKDGNWEWQVADGFSEFAKDCKENDIKLVAFSNGDPRWLPNKVEGHDLGQYFDLVVGTNENDNKQKDEEKLGFSATKDSMAVDLLHALCSEKLGEQKYVALANKELEGVDLTPQYDAGNEEKVKDIKVQPHVLDPAQESAMIKILQEKDVQVTVIGDSKKDQDVLRKLHEVDLKANLILMNPYGQLVDDAAKGKFTEKELKELKVCKDFHEVLREINIAGKDAEATESQQMVSDTEEPPLTQTAGANSEEPSKAEDAEEKVDTNNEQTTAEGPVLRSAAQENSPA